MWKIANCGFETSSNVLELLGCFEGTFLSFATMEGVYHKSIYVGVMPATFVATREMVQGRGKGGVPCL